MSQPFFYQPPCTMSWQGLRQGSLCLSSITQKEAHAKPGVARSTALMPASWLFSIFLMTFCLGTPDQGMQIFQPWSSLMLAQPTPMTKQRWSTPVDGRGQQRNDRGWVERWMDGRWSAPTEEDAVERMDGRQTEPCVFNFHLPHSAIVCQAAAVAPGIDHSCTVCAKLKL